jgi:hypothetical protein
MSTTTAPTITVCAWCQEENGDVVDEETSHGVCQAHSDQLLVNYYWQKLQSTPSYVERFKDERELL